ncbi:MAG: hypothetical protein HOG49_26750 [Candidatus Scalindua sp.]|nr:hypothetical protein [Candidatus Scalindua sp.]
MIEDKAYALIYFVCAIISLVFIQEDSKRNGFTGAQYALANVVVAFMWPIYYVFKMIRLWAHWRRRLKHPWLNE